MTSDALMMDFPDESSARLAADTYEELGYDPHLHEGGRLHIHVRNEDLTSALEIMQSCGGRLVEPAKTDSAALTNAAYSMDAIPIPAHTVNEDWVDEYASGETDWSQDAAETDWSPDAAETDGSPAAEAESLLADDHSYDRFEG